MSDLKNATSVELQALVDLAQLLKSWTIAESVGMVVNGSPVLSMVINVLNEGESRGITPRAAVVYPLDLLSQMLLNADGGLPTRFKEEIEFPIEARRIGDLESGTHYYHYRIGFGDDPVGEVRVCRGGIEINYKGQKYLIDVAKIFAAFVQKLGG